MADRRPAAPGQRANSKPGPGPVSSDEVDDLVEEAEDALEDDFDDEGELDALAAERDGYLDRLQRLQAEFANYRKRMAKQQAEHEERATEGLVKKLLPVLDNFDLALGHGGDDLAPVHRSLLGVLEAAGLQRIDPAGQPFDPNEHDAVQHEEGDGESEVTEVHRAGYRWKGRVLRPAMVKVKG